MRHVLLLSAMTLALSIPAFAQEPPEPAEPEVVLTGIDAWNEMVADADYAYAERPRAIMKIDDTVYLDDGQQAWLMRSEEGRTHYYWTMDAPQDYTLDRDDYAVLSIALEGETAPMTVVNVENNLEQLAVMREMATATGIEMPPMAMAQQVEMFAYHDENESFVFDGDVELTAYPTQMRPGETGMRAAVFNQNHPDAEHFEGLRWYPYNEDLIVEAQFEPLDEFTPITFQTSRGWYKQFYNVGTAVFELDGQEVRMPLYGFVTDPAEVTAMSSFFTDAQSGTETYGVGRYLDVEIEEGSFPPETVTVDFNYAYNPLCARSDHYNCPYAEFDIPLTVAAGEMIPEGDH